MDGQNREKMEGKRWQESDVNSTGESSIGGAIAENSNFGVRWPETPASSPPVHDNPNAVNHWGGPQNVRPGDYGGYQKGMSYVVEELKEYDYDRSSGQVRAPYQKRENQGRYDNFGSQPGRTYQERSNQRGGSYKVPSGKSGETCGNPTGQRGLVKDKLGPIYHSKDQRGPRNYTSTGPVKQQRKAFGGNRGGGRSSKTQGRLGRGRSVGRNSLHRPLPFRGSDVQAHAHEHAHRRTGPLVHFQGIPVGQRATRSGTAGEYGVPTGHAVGPSRAARPVAGGSSGEAQGSQGGSRPVGKNSLLRPPPFRGADAQAYTQAYAGQLPHYQGIPKGQETTRSGTAGEYGVPTVHVVVPYRAAGPGQGASGGPGGYSVGLYSDPSGFATFGGSTSPGRSLVGVGGYGVVGPNTYGLGQAEGIISQNVGPCIGPIIYNGPTGLQIGNIYLPENCCPGQFIGMPIPPWQVGRIGLELPGQVGGIDQITYPYKNLENQGRASLEGKGNQGKGACHYKMSVDQRRVQNNLTSNNDVSPYDEQSYREKSVNRTLSRWDRAKQVQQAFGEQNKAYNTGNPNKRFLSEKSGFKYNEIKNDTNNTRSGGNAFGQLRPSQKTSFGGPAGRGRVTGRIREEYYENRWFPTADQDEYSYDNVQERGRQMAPRGREERRLAPREGYKDGKFAEVRGRGVLVSRGRGLINRGGGYTGFKNVQDFNLQSQENPISGGYQSYEECKHDYSRESSIDKPNNYKNYVGGSAIHPNIGFIRRSFTDPSQGTNRDVSKKRTVSSIKIGGGPILDNETLQNYRHIIESGRNRTCSLAPSLRRSDQSGYFRGESSTSDKGESFRGDGGGITRGIVNQYDRGSYYGGGSDRYYGDENGGRGRGIGAVRNARDPSTGYSRGATGGSDRGPSVGTGRGAGPFRGRNLTFKDDSEGCD